MRWGQAMAMDEVAGTTRVVHIPDDIASRSQGVWRRRLLLAFAGAAFVSAAAWFGWYWWTTGGFVQWTDDAYIGAEVTPLSSRVAGFIERVAVVDNQSAKAGDLLVKIDDRDYRAQLAHAEASVAVRQATLANLDAKRHLQEAAIEEASADIAATTAELARAKSDLDRYRTLSDNRIASVQRFQQADADYEKAQAAARKARAVLDAAERELSVIDAEKQQSQAALHQAEADRDVARLNLDYTEIRRRCRRQPKRPRRRVCDDRKSAFVHRPAIRSVGRRQLQGKPAGPLARGTTGRDHCRRASGRQLSWARREPCAGDGRSVQHHPAGERHR